MRILHTSDWHLGQTWNGRSRKREFDAFLDWLLDLLRERNVDVLLVAGDVFDTTTPPPETLKTYFGFLKRVSTVCRHTVIVAGNHDSPTLLDAPKLLLRELNIHVVGTAARPEEELLVLNDAGDASPSLLIAAVPFLRDRDIRRGVESESLKETDNRTVAGIRAHYDAVCSAAEEIRQRNPDRSIPLIATGHLFVAGIESPGNIREIHVGALGQLGSDVFPDGIDYLALGHIHRPSRIAGREFQRYSGSPIPMSFGEAAQEKSVVLVDFDDRAPRLEKIPVPRFSNILHIEGDLETIRDGLKSLQDDPDDRDCFVEIVYDGPEPVHDLVRQVEEAVTKKNVEIVRVQNSREKTVGRLDVETGVKLEELDPVDVFDRLLEDNRKQGAAFDDRLETQLRLAYREILSQCLETE